MNEVSPHRVPERLQLTDLVGAVDHMARYRFALQWAPGARVLDLCCGVGYGSLLLAAAQAKRVLGVDLAPEALEAACALPPLPNLAFQQGDACAAYGEAGAWDLVVVLEGIEHVSEPAALLATAYDALRPGGRLVVSTPNADAFGGYSGNPYHVAEMREAEFRALLARWPWELAWYGQFLPEHLWLRPAWRRRLTRLGRRLLRRGWATGGHGGDSSGEPADDGVTRAEDGVDIAYPVPWALARDVVYSVPAVILAVARKPA